jgi:hypothetical protein
MALDLTDFAAILQAKLDALSGSSDPKDFLLLAKAFEATLGSVYIADLTEAALARIAQIEATGVTGSVVTITPTGDLTATTAQAAFAQLLGFILARQTLAEKDQPNGYAGLDAGGRLTTSQLPEEVLGAMSYRGTWNAATNTPAIPAAATANKGWYYVVATDGTTNIDGTAVWHVGDWIVSNGTKWDKIDSTDQVTAVAGLVGNITKEALKMALTLVIADISGLQSALDAKQPKPNIIPVTTSATLPAIKDCLYICTANAPILTLPTNPSYGDTVDVIRRGATLVTIVPPASSSVTIADVAEPFSLDEDKRSVRFMWIGTTWMVEAGRVG